MHTTTFTTACSPSVAALAVWHAWRCRCRLLATRQRCPPMVPGLHARPSPHPGPEPAYRRSSPLWHTPPHPALPVNRRRDIFSCLQRGLPALNYTTPLTAWLEAFPREQIMLLQVGQRRCGAACHKLCSLRWRAANPPCASYMVPAPPGSMHGRAGLICVCSAAHTAQLSPIHVDGSLACVSAVREPDQPRVHGSSPACGEDVSGQGRALLPAATGMPPM